MQFIITARTALTFNDDYMKQGLEKEKVTIDEIKAELKEMFTELIANEMSSPDGDFLGYSLSVEVETVDMAEVEEILEREG